MRTLRMTVLLMAVVATVALAGPMTALADGPPRPGCGYGDEQHNHQAAPGLDPEGLRPGDGRGDANHEHTAPPGQAPEDGGEADNPQRGCKPDPRGQGR
jgi:hypothetical protein